VRSRLAPIVLFLVAGCHSAPPADPALEEVNGALSSAGLKLVAFAPTDGRSLGAELCLGGKIDGVDALLCRFPSPEAAHNARGAGEEWVAGATTGAAFDRGRVLLVVADRAHVDPNGKTIHKIAQAFNPKK
jgi:hypothetical protein